MNKPFLSILFIITVFCSCNTSYETVQYEELTPSEFREKLNNAPVAYLPLGTLEYHGEHLPLGTDALHSKGFFTKLEVATGSRIRFIT